MNVASVVRLLLPVVLTSLIGAHQLLADDVARSGSNDWPAFRGPVGNGITNSSTAPIHWSASENIKWKAPLPKMANGSPIVSNGRVFVTSAEDDDGKQRSLYCFDRATGKQLWVKTVTFDKKMPTHQTNPYCGSTPAANGQRVVVWHASAGLYCYDFEGKELWNRSFGEFEHIWGYGTSPVIYGDNVIMHCGPGKKIFMTMVSLKDGKTVWQVDEPVSGDGSNREGGGYVGSWCTPLVATVGGQDQVICALPTRVVAYAPADGSIIWSCGGVPHMGGDLAYSSPIIAGDVCFVTGGFKGPSLGIRLGGKGDVTETHRLWRHENNPQSIGSGVYIDGYVYRPNAGPGTLQCLDPATGNSVWEDRGSGANFWGSIAYAAGRCYVTDQSGTTVVFQPNPQKCEILAKNELSEPSHSTPAISNGEIFIRTAKHLFCIAE